MSPSVMDMVKIEAAAVTTQNQLHPLQSRLASMYEFRLQGSRENSEIMTSTAFAAPTITASSVGSDRLSIHKQKIDSMFDDNRSSLSGFGTPSFSRRGRVILDDLEEEDEEEYDEVDDGTQNTVQERIQKMFAEVTEEEKVAPGDNSKAKEELGSRNEDDKRLLQNGIVLSSPSQPVQVPPQVFSVHYLGSAPLPNRDATLQAIQAPLKTLYFRYRALEACGRAPPLDGTLEISSDGLRVKMERISDERKSAAEVKTEKLDKLNKFPSIAVWAAVKFVNRDPDEKIALGEESTRYAFLPLIADPDGRDKSSLFRTLPRKELDLAKGVHSPMFAVVMRRSSRPNGSNAVTKRTLHCHAFVCACSEDAIVMAANLYQALVAGMSAGRKEKVKQTTDVAATANTRVVDPEPPATPIRMESRGITSVPKRPSSLSGGDIGRISPPRQSDVMSTASAPVRPPRRKKGSSRYGDDSRSMNSEEFLSLEDEEERLRKEEPVVRRLPSSLTNNQSMSSNRSPSMPKLSITPKDASGDIFTRVVIPRSGSFLENGANLRRSSSMGLGDLFQEVRAQEGLTSLDSILEKIVDADGMSFARLKPIYREFLLKLAATLSRDELYMRSKNIMRKQASLRRRRRRRKSEFAVGTLDDLKQANNAEDDLSSACGDSSGENCAGRFSWALCSSVSKMRSKSSGSMTRHDKRKSGGKRGESGKSGGDGTSCNFEFTSVIFPSETRRQRARAGSSSISSSMSSNSRASKSRRQRRKQFHSHRPSFNAGRSVRGSSEEQKRIGVTAENIQRRQRVSASEDSSDFFSFKRKNSERNHGTVYTNTKSSSRMGSSGTGLGGGRSSSGYVSCSDCSLDSKSCNSDKCYCPQEPLRRHHTNRSSIGSRRDSIRSGMYAEVLHRGGSRACQRADCSGCGVGGKENVQGAPRGQIQCRSRQACSRQCGGHKECRGSCTPACGCHSHGCGGVNRCSSAQFVAVQSCSMHGQMSCSGCSMGEARCVQMGRSCSCCCRSRKDSSSAAWRKNETRVSGNKRSEGGRPPENEDEDWEDEEEDDSAAVVLEDGASATSSSSWRPGAAVPRNRMDVYATLPPPRPLPDAPAPASVQRDNSSAAFDRFNGSSKNRPDGGHRPSSSQVLNCIANIEAKQQKVLVVSARDPRGRLICMGRGDQSNMVHTANGGPRASQGRLQCCPKSAASEALSVKKSAEIAALFSNVRGNSHVGTMVTSDEVVYTTLEPQRQNIVQSKPNNVELFIRRNCYNGGSLENTLGYLP